MEFSEDFPIVPTLQEAFDLIELEEIERQLDYKTLIKTILYETNFTFCSSSIFLTIICTKYTMCTRINESRFFIWFVARHDTKSTNCS